MADEEDSKEISEIREVARRQFDTEKQSVELTEVMTQVSKSLQQQVKNADNIKEQRMALGEIRKVHDDLREQQDKIKKISEYSVEELWDELIRLVESKEAERTAEPDQTV